MHTEIILSGDGWHVSTRGTEAFIVKTDGPAEIVFTVPVTFVEKLRQLRKAEEAFKAELEARHAVEEDLAKVRRELLDRSKAFDSQAKADRVEIE